MRKSGKPDLAWIVYRLRALGGPGSPAHHERTFVHGANRTSLQALVLRRIRDTGGLPDAWQAPPAL